MGLKNKKDYVYKTLKENDIDICLLQEVEVPHEHNHTLLSDVSYKIEIEKNSIKSRCAIAIKNTICYERRLDIEKEDLGIVILDLNGQDKYRIVNVYRSFNPPNNATPLAFFKSQLKIIETAVTTSVNRKIIIAGDFNLNENNRYHTNHNSKYLFENLNALCEHLNLIQIVNFPTWQRVVNNVLKESILDHIYVKNPFIIENISAIIPLIGDHRLIRFEIKSRPDPPQTFLRRNWKNYSKDKLIQALAAVDFSVETDSVQASWNLFENSVIEIVDNLAPLELTEANSTSKVAKNVNLNVKRKLSLRKRLIKNLKTNPSNNLRDRINNLNYEIRTHFKNSKRNEIRNKIIPGNSKSLWDAVKIAKNVNKPNLPPKLTKNDIEIAPSELPDTFAEYFKNKVENIVLDQTINNEVYNGVRKLYCADVHFMSIENILEAVNSLKNKKCEGHDRIPQKILIDGIEILKFPLSYLFNQIFTQKKIPEQWLIAKVIPIFKKGSNLKIENYRPISNLCSTSKIFEKLILLRIEKIQQLKKLDLTGKPQHGFKKKHSTKTAGIKLQSILARALDDNNYAIMATLDLSSAFDVVNVDLLLIRLKVMGLPHDIITLLSEWLKTRYFYVSIGGESSYIHHCGVGTVQGSILGPLLYALFVSPLFDLACMTMFADDNYVIVWHKQLNILSIEIKNTLETIIRWFKDSGLKVNDEKTVMCLFYRNDIAPITITINTKIITSTPTMNVLGVTFDSKLNWQNHVEIAIKKSQKALQAVKLIQPFMLKSELLTILKSNFYSILYYNADIWLLPSLKQILKTKLTSTSAGALKMCCFGYDRTISYEKLHELVKYPNPIQICLFNHSLLLYKIYNDPQESRDWLDLFFNQNFNARSNFVSFYDTSKFKPGKNLLANRFVAINRKIPYDWLNLPFSKYKSLSKNEFLCVY